jgi:hypothetical protein
LGQERQEEFGTHSFRICVRLNKIMRKGEKQDKRKEVRKGRGRKRRGEKERTKKTEEKEKEEREEAERIFWYTFISHLCPSE